MLFRRGDVLMDLVLIYKNALPAVSGLQGPDTTTVPS